MRADVSIETMKAATDGYRRPAVIRCNTVQYMTARHPTSRSPPLLSLNLTLPSPPHHTTPLNIQRTVQELHSSAPVGLPGLPPGPIRALYQDPRGAGRLCGHPAGREAGGVLLGVLPPPVRLGVQQGE